MNRELDNLSTLTSEKYEMCPLLKLLILISIIYILFNINKEQFSQIKLFNYCKKLTPKALLF